MSYKYITILPNNTLIQPIFNTDAYKYIHAIFRDRRYVGLFQVLCRWNLLKNANILSVVYPYIRGVKHIVLRAYCNLIIPCILAAFSKILIYKTVERLYNRQQIKLCRNHCTNCNMIQTYINAAGFQADKQMEVFQCQTGDTP